MAGRRQGGGMIVLKRCTIMFLTLSLSILGQSVAGFADDKNAATSAQQNDLSVLLNTIGKKASAFTSLKTEFTQEKEMAMFKEKLVLKGRIFLQKPNKIAWHVDSPVRYSVLITDTFIRQWDEDTNKVQELSLAKNPVFQNVLNQLTVWFSGEYGSLTTVNDVRVKQNTPLVLEFVPLEKNVSHKIIKSILITFREDQTYLKRIQILEKSGDMTTITFTNTLLNVPLDSADFEVKR
jgi:outer membrane lipoprotein carrier protein